MVQETSNLWWKKTLCLSLSVCVRVCVCARAPTCHGELPLLMLEGEDVAGAAGGSQHHEEEGGGDEAVQEEDEEHEDVVGLEVLDVLVHPLGQPARRWGHLEFICNV